MPFYTQKPFRAEIIEVTADNINNVFTWVSASPTVNAHSLTSTSFIIVWGGTGNVTQTVEVGGYVVKEMIMLLLPCQLMGERFRNGIS